MVRVMAVGVFDLLHLGHVHYLTEAKKLGDELVVVVARDSTAKQVKHQPITNEEMRRQLVESLKPVDMAVLGKEGNIYDILPEIKPDIVALGYDQQHDEIRVLNEAKSRGLENLKVARMPKFEGDIDGTRKIVAKVADWLSMQRKLAPYERKKV